MSRRAAAALALLTVACASSAPPGPARTTPAIRVISTKVPLDATQLTVQAVGNFTYAGGLWLTSPDTQRLHGLSDLKIWPDGRLLSVSDEGDLFEARIDLDADGRLSGVGEARLSPLKAADGRPLSELGKNEADSEGVAELPNGDRLVSLERDDRILPYPANGGPPRAAPMPDARFPFNLGMEGLAQDPDTAADAYVVGGESTGQTWNCRLASGCAIGPKVGLPSSDAGLSAIAVLPDGRRAYLLRAFSLLRGLRVTLRVTDARGATTDEIRLASPLTVDNFEGLAGLPRPDGSIRFYLLSDDNFSKAERTLLLAFDWKPPRGR